MTRRRRKNPYIFAPEQKRRRGRHALLRLTVFLALIVFTGILLNFIIGHQVDYPTQYVTVSGLPADLESWSILHISDLHGEELGKGQSLLRGQLDGLRASSVVFTGDMLGEGGDTSALLALVAMLPADVPKLMVMGDEDAPYLDPMPHASVSPLADWAIEVTQAGVTILDEPVLFTRGRRNDARIWFVPEYLYSLDLNSLEQAYAAQLAQLPETGLTAEEAARRRVAEYQLARVERIRASVASMKETDVQIALSHTPLAESYITEMLQITDKERVFSLRNVDLVLSGHYCGGQWRLPGVGALYVPEFGWLPEEKLLSGLSFVGSVQQYISRGLGASGAYPNMPGRLFNSPEMTYILLTSRIQ